MSVWTVHLEGGPRRVNHAAVAIGEKIYSFGGYCTGEDYEIKRPMDVHVLDTVSYRWKALPIQPLTLREDNCVPYQRYGHSAVAYGDCAYIWGGRNDGEGACNILYSFNTIHEKWSRVPIHVDDGTCIPGARDGHSACVIANKMYIFGGYLEWHDRFSNDVHAYDFETHQWDLIFATGSPARWRDFQSAVGIGDFMYIFGGRSDRAGAFHTNNEIYCNKIQAFNIKDKQWHEPATTGLTPMGRRSHSAFVYNNNMYIFGGYTGIHDVHFDDIYKFNPESNHWSVAKIGGKGPCPRRRQCCCVISHKVFLFGGTSVEAFHRRLLFDHWRTARHHKANVRKDSPCAEPMEGTDGDLMDHSDLHVLDFLPSLKTLCLMVVLERNLETNLLPRDIRWELAAMTTNNNISRPVNSNG